MLSSDFVQISDPATVALSVFKYISYLVANTVIAH